MNRLARLLKKANSISKEIPEEFWNTVHALDLKEGEFMPLDIPSESWIFVDQGCLMLMRCLRQKWVCFDVYNEGATMVVHNTGAADMEEDSYHIKAAVDSIVYYFTPEERTGIEAIYPGFLQAQSNLHNHSFMHYLKRNRLLRFEPLERIGIAESKLSFLFKLPVEALAEYLIIRSKPLKNALAKAQERYRLQRNVPRQPE